MTLQDSPPPVSRVWLDRLLDYLELVRLPNLFTATADVMMGLLVVRPFDTDDTLLFVLLAAASCLLYAGGVALNDVFDYLLDLEQRSERPLPSGRISRAAAAWLGAILLASGAAATVGAAWLARSPRTGLIGLLLMGAILLYDARLKRTGLGPVVMGACRFLNVLLGLSVYPGVWHEIHWLLAACVGAYVGGVTWFARNEAEESPRPQLIAALAVMLSGIGLLALLPQWPEEVSQLLVSDPQRWRLIVAVLAAMIGWRCVWAVVDPRPVRVRMAVRQCVLSLVMLDAVACYAVRGLPGAIIVLVLLIPTLLLGQLFEST
jgi:hypothetical protein